MKTPTNPGALVDRAGIREILGVTKARVHQMTSEPGFPAPFDVPNPRNPIWLRAKVEAYAKTRAEKIAAAVVENERKAEKAADAVLDAKLDA